MTRTSLTRKSRTHSRLLHYENSNTNTGTPRNVRKDVPMVRNNSRRVKSLFRVRTTHGRISIVLVSRDFSIVSRLDMNGTSTIVHTTIVTIRHPKSYRDTSLTFSIPILSIPQVYLNTFWKLVLTARTFVFFDFTQVLPTKT